MAKDQNLALNPQKVSGLCGRLMCCLAYEQSTYEAIWGQIPKIGKRVNTPKGEGRVMSVDIKSQKVRTLIGDDMEVFTVEEIRELNKDMVRGQRGHRGPSQTDRGPQQSPSPEDEPPPAPAEGQAASSGEPSGQPQQPSPRQERPERQGQRGQSRPPQRSSQRSDGGSRRDGQRQQPRPQQQQQTQGQSQQAQGPQIQPRPSQQMQGPMPRARQSQRGFSQAMQGGRADNRGPRSQQQPAAQPGVEQQSQQIATPVAPAEAPARPSDELIKSALAPMLSPDPVVEKAPGEGEK